MLESLTSRVMRTCPVAPWAGDVWRVHQRRFRPDDGRGSLLYSGRWNRGADQFPESNVFPALYTATTPNVVTWEYIRHSRRDDGTQMWARFLALTQSKQRVVLPAVIDLRDPSPAGITITSGLPQVIR